MSQITAWTEADAREYIAVPRESDDKYSRGVVGFVTGSERYPGAAVLGVEAALRAGVGMVRYLGAELPSRLVLERRPETVTARGRVQAWVLGSGTDHADLGDETRQLFTLALAQGVPTVLDGGALEWVGTAERPTILTPHRGELARLLAVDRERVEADPAAAAREAAERFGATILLKGHTTYAVGPDTMLSASAAPSWLATAGAGDALAGILGALVATHSAGVVEDDALLARLGATAAVLHGLAAARASAGGPLTILDLAAALPSTIAELLAER